MDNMLDGILLGVPESTANLQLPDPDLRNLYRDEQERVYWVDNEIDDSLLELVKMIMRCNKEDKDIAVENRKPIKVFIASPGGDVVSLWTTMQAIQMSKTPVWTIAFSYCYSAAAELLIAGQKRFALKGVQIMYHRGSCYFGGEQSVVESTKKHFDGLEKKLTDFLLEHTKINPKTYRKRASTDIYMDEDMALENGVIDRIIEDFDEIV